MFIFWRGLIPRRRRQPDWWRPGQVAYSGTKLLYQPEPRPVVYIVPVRNDLGRRMAIDDDFAPGLNLFGPFCPILPLLQDSTAQRKWKNEQSINCMSESGPTKWTPVPLLDRETCGGVRMATALIVVPGSRVWICYPGPGSRNAHWKIYEIKSARKNILNFSMNKK